MLPAVSHNDLWAAARYLNDQLHKRGVHYYFFGGFACINVAMTARTTADIDLAIPNGQHGLGELLSIINDKHGPFVYDETKFLGDSPFFFVESTGKLVEVDHPIAGMHALPPVEDKNLIEVGPDHVKFLKPAGLLELKLTGWSQKSRREGPKRAGDLADTRSIREVLINDKVHVDTGKWNKDARHGLKEWVHEFHDEAEWKKVDPHFHV